MSHNGFQLTAPSAGQSSSMDWTQLHKLLLYYYRLGGYFPKCVSTCGFLICFSQMFVCDSQELELCKYRLYSIGILNLGQTVLSQSNFTFVNY